MTGENLTITRAQFALKLQISPERFGRIRKELEARGMPAPLFGRGQGERWSEKQADDWINSGGAKSLARPPAPDSPEDWAGRLDKNAEAVAAGGRA